MQEERMKEHQEEIQRKAGELRRIFGNGPLFGQAYILMIQSIDERIEKEKRPVGKCPTCGKTK